jgi:6-pyruvoyl-tetrahydropterin synthase
MKKIAEMFLSELSIVDHAFINIWGNVEGGSFNPTFFVSGEIDPIENVVVDFSTIKKDIKAIIDSKEIGFDHKLWFIEGYSQGEYLIEDDQISITTPTTSLLLPTNAVKIIKHDSVTPTTHSTESIGAVFAQLVQEELRKQYGASISVECRNTITVHSPLGDHASFAYFSYVHGLKDSTSWGCQNVAHGHLSFVQIQPVTPDTKILARTIAEDIDETIFINKENILHQDDDTITIGYTTGRGYFETTYTFAAYRSIIILETETTIEHLVDFISNVYMQALNEVNATALYVSEGLSKGAVVRS